MGEKKSGIKGKKTKVELLKEHLLYTALENTLTIADMKVLLQVQKKNMMKP